MTISSTERLAAELAEYHELSSPVYAGFIETLLTLPAQRPIVDTITPEDTVVVCRREILNEAIAYYQKRYTTLPVFYTFSPNASVYKAESDVIVRDVETLSSEQKVHIFTSLTARRPGHSGISFLVRHLANKNILNPSVEKNSVSRFFDEFTPEPLRPEDIMNMAACYNQLSDAESKQAYLGICKARLLGDFSYTHLALYPQYFHPVVHAEEGDILCEGGICDGKTSVKLTKAIGESGALYGFEPVPECYKLSLKRTAQSPAIHLENKALWKNTTTLKLSITNPTQGYSSVISSGTAEASCSTTSIDEYFSDKPAPTLIKLDVEGAEIPVLEGAMQTIRAHRPKLMVSIYHTNNGNDLVNIPKFLLDANLGYSFYVGHHSVWFNETILYCIAK
ncbi:FkbM family methyltransferase [Halodesulfovibrio marinisediminis]|uniref:Methyltransferase, FkbM family n=1 Tax=Halodesulfovibrio marinisediminis DSM 17456 TaxID=1121457 RepID=A0A1N6GXK9_9BACT|nr:FkbM family methyltransferase [Halodesulfovibrio marinisediminis]SIO12321.1 methyltransferase, FkbM family [Halodesulfovibrio marinisediminis DSM 17456]